MTVHRKLFFDIILIRYKVKIWYLISGKTGFTVYIFLLFHLNYNSLRHKILRNMETLIRFLQNKNTHI